MTQARVETSWIMDRGRLIACKAKHEALAGYYAERDTALSN